MKKKMNNEKIILISLICYFVIMLIIFLPGYIERKRNKLYIIAPLYSIKYEDGKWSKLTDTSDYNSKKFFNVSINNEYLGEYQVIISDYRPILLDRNGEKYNYDGSIFAYQGTIKLDKIDFDLGEEIFESDKDIIRKALKQVDIPDDAYFNITQKVSIDVDNDSKEEIIYGVDNIIYSDDGDFVLGTCVPNDSGYNFSLVVIYKNNKVTVLDKVITKDNLYSTFYFEDLLDVKKNGKLDLVYFDQDIYSISSNCTKMVSLSKNKIIYDSCSEK